MLSPVLYVMSYGLYVICYSLWSLVSPIGPPAISYALYGMSYEATSNIICLEWYFLWLMSHEYGLFVLVCYVVHFLWLFLRFLWHFLWALCYIL